MVEAVSHDTVWKLFTVVLDIMLPTYTHARTHTQTDIHTHR